MGYLKDIKCPIFNAERIKESDLPENSLYAVEFGGNLDKKISLNLNDLKNLFNKSSIDRRLTSISQWSVRAEWSGILWSDLINYINPKEYKYIYFESYGKYVTCIESKDIEEDNAILCYEVNGEALEFEYGGPVRMVIPNLWGYKSCKWLKRIYFMDEYVVGFWEAMGYPDEGHITSMIVQDINSGDYRKINGGEVKDF